MNINPVSVNNYVAGAAVAPVQAAPLQAAPPELPADSVSLVASVPVKQEDAPVAASSAVTKAAGKPQLSEAEVEQILTQSLALSSDPAQAAAPATLSASDFLSASCSLDASGALPTREAVADYRHISTDEAIATFNNEVKGSLSLAEKGVLKAYCTVAFPLMNGYKLGLKGSPTGTVKRACQCMQKGLEKFDVPAGTVLYRTANLNELRNYVTAEQFDKYAKMDKAGHTEEMAQILDSRLQGTESKRKSFISTTIDHTFNFEDKPKVATKLYVGENVHGIYVGAGISRFPDEKEFLLAADTKTTVLGVDYDPKSKGLVMHVFLGDMPAQDV